MTKKMKLLFLMFIVLTLGSAFFKVTAYADGGISRKTTPAEKKFLETLHSELRAVLPKAPEKWQCDIEPERKYDEIGEGFEKYPVVMGAAASYVKIETQAEGEAKEKAMVEIGEKKKPSIDVIMKKQEELALKIGKAAESMDMKEIEKLQKESEILAKEAEKLGNETTAEMRSSSAGNLLKSTNANINAGVNPSEIYIINPVELPKIDGCFVLREKKEGPESADKSKTVILAGPWKIEKNSEGALEIKSPYNESAAYDKIMCAAVHIEAPDDIAETLMKTVDLKKLNSLIGK